MKAMIITVLLGLSCLSVSAFAWGNGDRPGGPGFPGGPGNGPGGGSASLSCTYTDRGFEEHWGGHKSCQECKAKHGRCNETCSIEFGTAEVRGVDFKGVSITLKGNGRDRYDAERNALKYCQRNFTDCSVTTSNSSSEQVSTRECQ